MAYTKSDYNPTIKQENNVRFVDPNPPMETVPPEDLFIFVKLKARQKTKSVITEGVNKNREANDIVLSVPQKTVESVAGNKLFKPKDQLTTDWTEIGGHLMTGQKLYQDLEGFGITNIDIEIKSQTSPKVVIDFIDVRGATLFEQGSCSPYGLFFNLPYPIFELTVKGYYGKPVNYYLNLVKFNAKFNSDTGNMECRAEFLGYTFAFLADIIVWYVLSSQFLKEDSWQPQKKLRAKYRATKEYYLNAEINEANGETLDPDIDETPWCDNPKIGDKCTTLFHLLNFLDTFDEVDKPDIVGSPEYKAVTDLTQLETYYKAYRERVYDFVKELQDGGYTAIYSTSKQAGPYRFTFSTDQVNTLTLSGGTISSYFNTTNGNLKSAIKDVLTFKVNKESVYKDPYNLKCGTTNQTQFEQDPPPGSYTLYDSDNFKNSDWLSVGIKKALGYSSPTKDISGTTEFLDVGYLLQDIENELKLINSDDPKKPGILTKKRRELIDGVNAIIEAKLGFKPSIKNIFTVILCNTDAFMDILLDVYAKAEQQHIDNIGELKEYRKNSGNNNIILSGEEKVYPWPTYIRKQFTALKGDSTIQGEKEVYPGRDFPNWWECRFVEDFIKAMIDAKEAVDVLDNKTEGKPGFDNYVPINPLESRMWFERTPIKYTKKTALNEIYQIIGERMFITLDHSFFQPIRLTDDALYIPRVGVESWNPIKNDVANTSENIVQRSGVIDSWNLLTSLDQLNTISAICNEASAEVFIEEVKKQLRLNGTLEDTTLTGADKKFSATTTYDKSGNVYTYKDSDIGFSSSDKFFVYKPTDGFITIKNDDSENPVKIFANPWKMKQEHLIKFIDPTKTFAKISFPDDTETGKKLKPDLEKWETTLNGGISNVNFASTSFEKEDDHYPKDLNEIFYEQKIVQFAKNQMFCALGMAFPSSINSASITWSKWWDNATGSFDEQTKDVAGGSIVSNMGLFTFWDDSIGPSFVSGANNAVNGMNLYMNAFVDENNTTPINGPNTINTVTTLQKNSSGNWVGNDTQKWVAFTPEPLGDNKIEVILNIPQYGGVPQNGLSVGATLISAIANINTDPTTGVLKTLNELGPLPIFSGLITTPLWLDNVNNFRKTLRTGYEYDKEIEYKNLAYLFLHSLKTTPLIQRIIDDDGYLYKKDVGSFQNGNPSLIWSLKAFNSVAGIAKVPKAWLLTLGAQLWRWKTFVGTKTVDGKTVWNKPLNCTNCGNGDTPKGYDPLIQPGFNSYDNNNLRRRWQYPTNDSPYTNNNKRIVFSRNEPDGYLKSIYGGVNGVNYNNVYTVKTKLKLKSVFSSYYQDRPFGQLININEIGPKVVGNYDVISFRYFPFVKDKYAGDLLGKLADATSDLASGGSDIGEIGNYSWPFIYIAPHHIPYLSPETFDDSGNASGSVFNLVTDSWIGYQDYLTLMPNTYNQKEYDESTVGTTGNSIDGLGTDGNTNRSRYEDGNLGMVMQYLPDDIKDMIVNEFVKFTDSPEWRDTMLPKIDPINFGKADIEKKITNSYYYYTGDNSPSRNIRQPGNVMLALQPNDDLLKLLTGQIWILNSTPKIWYGIGDETLTSSPISNNFNLSPTVGEGFVVSETQLNSYLKAFYQNYQAHVEDRKTDLRKQGQEEIAGLGDSILDDDDIKLSLYRTFKSLSDKWISASNTGKLFFNIRDTGTGSSCNGKGSKNGKSSLAAHFEYVNRVMGDIGDLAVIDLTKLNDLKENKKISLYQYLSEILTQNEYMFFPLPTYVNFGVRGVNEDDVKNMFRPVFSLDDVSCGPLFLCMYVGGTSRQLKMRTTVNCPLDQEVLDNIEDDSFSFSDVNQPNEIKDPGQYGNKDGYTAFKVLYGAENQNHFKNIQLDQAEFSETAESLLVIDKLGQQGGSDKSSKGQNLNAMYLTRSYTCTIESLGNLMIQPMTYFDLQGVPMFSGAYIITEVRHNIKPNHATTTFKGVRQPRATVPIVTDAAVAMNISFKGVSPNGEGKSLKDQVEAAGGNSAGGGNGGGGGAGGNGNPEAKVYAAYDGEVVIAGPATGFGAPPNGGWVVVRHGLNQGADVFSDGNYYFFVYGHINPSVSVGDKVIKGQEIGTAVWPNINADGSRCASTGLHLHLQVHQLKSKSYVCDSRDCIGKIAPNPFINQGADKSVDSIGSYTSGKSPKGYDLFPDLSSLTELKDFVNPVNSSNKPRVTSQMFRGSSGGNFSKGDYHGALDIGFSAPDAGTSITPPVASVDNTGSGSGTKSSGKTSISALGQRLNYLGLVS